MSQDPIGLHSGEPNFYAYVHNPLTWIDPLGLANEECGKITKRTKQKGKLTEPNLPEKTIIVQDGVEIKHYYRSGDHGPAHLHVYGGGGNTKIGQAGKPLEGSPELTPTQTKVVEEHKAKIRKSIDQIQRWVRFENADG